MQNEDMTPAEWHNYDEYEADQMIVQESELEEEMEATEAFVGLPVVAHLNSEVSE